VVPNNVKKITIIPTVNSILTDPISSRFNVTYPLLSKVRYVMVYGSKFNSKIDINDPSHIIDKIVCKENSDTVEVVIPTYKLDKNTTCAISFIDFYGNESDPTLVHFTL
ncbi:glycosyl hydrolase, partial [Flavobacterium sp. XS1P32]